MFAPPRRTASPARAPARSIPPRRGSMACVPPDSSASRQRGRLPRSAARGDRPGANHGRVLQGFPQARYALQAVFAMHAVVTWL
jgi:hypothetical protein